MGLLLVGVIVAVGLLLLAAAIAPLVFCGDNDDENGTRGAIILELASVVDMYGVGSDVVGRRSFGGFHKSVMNTWNTALKRRTDDDTRTKNTRNHITDEELLERYEKYVKGRGCVEADGSGNRGRKEKRKRNT